MNWIKLAQILYEGKENLSECKRKKMTFEPEKDEFLNLLKFNLYLFVLETSHGVQILDQLQLNLCHRPADSVHDHANQQK